MPIYAYKCKSCDYQFDVRQRFSDDPLVGCPRCKGDIRRIISPVGVVFKGSGFYVTDNRNGKVNGATNGKTRKGDDKAEKSTEKDVKKTGSSDAISKKDASSTTDTGAGT
jgi:putative FmdB family regulatory protein